MWATVIVVYFIKFVYTVCMDAVLSTRTDFTSCVSMCERSTFMSTGAYYMLSTKEALKPLGLPLTVERVDRVTYSADTGLINIFLFLHI